jgi:uncharacterized protein
VYLYSAAGSLFVEDVLLNRIAEKLKISFADQLNRNVSPGELNAWRNSLQSFAHVLSHYELTNVGVVLEMQLPLTSKRLDCLLTGVDESGHPSAVIIELKQWADAEASSISDCVVAFVGQALRDMLHPSQQARLYKQYLEDSSTVFSDGAVSLSACSYLSNHQHSTDSALVANKFSGLLAEVPIFSGDQTQEFGQFLRQRLASGDGLETLKLVSASKYKASKKLLDHVSQVIKGRSEYVLLDEQQVVFNAVLGLVRGGYHHRQKTVVLVKGGPGTGKTIIALNLMAALSAEGYNVRHATGSRAFTGNLKKILGFRAGEQFSFFNNYVSTEYNCVDVLLCDEAHRLRPNSNNRFQKIKSDKRQVDELVFSSKVAAFLIDDLQVVRPGEVGSCDLIRSAAANAGAVLQEFELDGQFRCAGSEEFIRWVDATLGIMREERIWQPDGQFDFQVFDSVQDMAEAIRAKANNGYSARLVAGFCWPWSDPDSSGHLVEDVKLDRFSMPWNAKPDAGRLAAGIPKSNFWASDPNGINQVGCVYTAQGFEFDYVGVIFGRDLVYNGGWSGNRKVSHDNVVKKAREEEFVNLVKQTYRVLLTRGMKGCYVFFEDAGTKDLVRTRIKDEVVRVTSTSQS